MVHAAKALAIQMTNPEKANDWRRKNNSVSARKTKIMCGFVQLFNMCRLISIWNQSQLFGQQLQRGAQEQRFCFLFDYCKESFSF